VAKLPQLSRPSNRVSNAVRTWYALQRQKRRQKRRRSEAAGAVVGGESGAMLGGESGEILGGETL
jgi:hypothetical protein